MSTYEVISADQGAATAGAAQPTVQPTATATSYGAHGGYHGSHSMMSQEDYYQSAYSHSGAGPWTMSIILLSVMVGHFIFFGLMMLSCYSPRYVGYVRYDVEVRSVRPALSHPRGPSPARGSGAELACAGRRRMGLVQAALLAASASSSPCQSPPPAYPIPPSNRLWPSG